MSLYSMICIQSVHYSLGVTLYTAVYGIGIPIGTRYIMAKCIR